MLFCTTVGHSNYSCDTFIKILACHQIQAVIDIRSTPYSRRNPQFNRETLKTDLQLHDIMYIYMGDRLGGRHTDPKLLLPGGNVDFSRVRGLALFQEGIQQVVAHISTGERTALMCAERDPFDCHRFMLVSPALVRAGVTVSHIMAAGQQVSQDELEERLLNKYSKASLQPGLFERPKTRSQLLEEAYALKNQEM
jgi:uncharacterized protein (DUF488 family)